jgi:hypothetical protein
MTQAAGHTQFTLRSMAARAVSACGPLLHALQPTCHGHWQYASKLFGNVL